MIESEKEIILNSIEEAVRHVICEIEIFRIIALYGELGAGKTYFVRKTMEAMGLPTFMVSSPTFTICNVYSPNIVHIDCYRIKNEDELIEGGLLDYFSSDYIVFIEWAEKINRILSEYDFQKVTIILDYEVPFNEKTFTQTNTSLIPQVSFNRKYLIKRHYANRS